MTRAGREPFRFGAYIACTVQWSITYGGRNISAKVCDCKPNIVSVLPAVGGIGCQM